MDGGAGVDRGRRSSALFLGGRPKLRGHYFFLVFGHSVGATPTPPLTMAIPTQPLVLALATAAALLHSHAGVVLASGPFSPGYEGQFCLSPIDVHPDVDSNHSSPVGRLCCGADPTMCLTFQARPPTSAAAAGRAASTARTRPEVSFPYPPSASTRLFTGRGVPAPGASGVGPLSAADHHNVSHVPGAVVPCGPSHQKCIAAKNKPVYAFHLAGQPCRGTGT